MKGAAKRKLALVATARAVHVERWEWRQLIASEYGPASATTRHVLAVLALSMNSAGGNCYPSQSTIAKRTALTERAVKEHIALAKRSHWLEVTEHHNNGQGWRRNSYAATVPGALHPIVLELKKGAGSGLGISGERGEPGSKGGEPGSPMWGNQVPPNLNLNLIRESVRGRAAVDKSPRKAKSAAVDRSTKDDFKNRFSEKSGALRAQITAATKTVPRKSSSLTPHALSDEQLAAKVKKLREVGYDAGDIRRALGAHASAAQLTRVIKSLAA